MKLVNFTESNLSKMKKETIMLIDALKIANKAIKVFSEFSEKNLDVLNSVYRSTLNQMHLYLGMKITTEILTFNEYQRSLIVFKSKLGLPLDIMDGDEDRIHMHHEDIIEKLEKMK